MKVSIEGGLLCVNRNRALVVLLVVLCEAKGKLRKMLIS